MTQFCVSGFVTSYCSTSEQSITLGVIHGTATPAVSVPFQNDTEPSTGPGVTANGGVQGVCLGPWGDVNGYGRGAWDPGVLGVSVGGIPGTLGGVSGYRR